MMEETESVVLRRSNRGTAIVITIAAIFIFVVAIPMTLIGATIIGRQGIALSLVLLTIGLFMMFLGAKTWSEAMNMWHWSITLMPDELRVVLPRGRTNSHDVKQFSGTIPRASIGAVVTRLEGYKTMGFANLQRVFALQMTDGTYLHLGEDRAIGTDMYKPFYEGCVQTIVERYNLPVSDLGTVSAGGGFLGVIGVKVPAWDAVAADETEVSLLWQRARRTGVVMMVLVWIVLVAQFLGSFLD